MDRNTVALVIVIVIVIDLNFQTRKGLLIDRAVTSKSRQQQSSGGPTVSVHEVQAKGYFL